MRSEIDIYVSYARPDYEVLERFFDDLRRDLHMRFDREVSLWVDRSYIAAGSDWQDELRQALDQAKGMLVVVSPSYLHSQIARRECETFGRSGRPIFPVILEEFNPSGEEVRNLIGDLTSYTAPSLRRRNNKYHEFIAHLASDICDILARTPAPAKTSEQVIEKPPSPLPMHSAKGYVFLSYAEEDADFLAELRTFFGDKGYAYWEFETSDRDYQKRIDLELEGVISSAVATVSVLSEAWKASTWSLRELFFSQEISKPVFLLKAKPISPTLAIAGFPYIDFTKDSQQAFSRLAKELKRAGL